jgi:DNA-binding Lrp family transcriptional regulator
MAQAVFRGDHEFPEVVEFYRMSGDIDYLLRVVVPDIAAYDAFYKRLIAKIEIRDVSSSFAMEQIKYTTSCRSITSSLPRKNGILTCAPPRAWREHSLSMQARRGLRVFGI